MNKEECWACGSDVCVCAEGSAKYCTGLIEAAVKAEREACAKLCDELAEKGFVAEGCAAAIRARSEK